MFEKAILILNKPVMPFFWTLRFDLISQTHCHNGALPTEHVAIAEILPHGLPAI